MNKDIKEKSASFVDAMINNSGLSDLTDYQTILLYLGQAEGDIDNLIQHWNEALMRLQKLPDECDHLECTEHECIGWINGLQVAKRYITLMKYEPTFLETTERKIHNKEALRLQKIRDKRRRKKNKGKNATKNKSK